ncbi:hypothetical protein K7711_13915 [Nocardia sp. CA2R105]|uniref:hypothetical protein n=1 Tax=Nocardia coffeae TaxID=2873381 RepID=UPI001CA7A563|nr:hypothetical protein [Nocardia coffeae]MBY8857581.1 hypothetical protein [Nocardia coffeae]
MSETTPPTPPTSGRVRRRASRQAGPVGEQANTGAATVVPTASSPASGAAQASAVTDTTVKADSVPMDAEPGSEVSAAGKAAGPVSDGDVTPTVASESSAKTDAVDGDSTVKLGTADADSTVKLGTADADSTVKLGTADVDSTVKLGTADADSTVKLGKAVSGVRPGASGADPVDEPIDASDTEGELVSEKDGFWRSMRPIEWVAAVVAVVSLLALVGGGGVYFYHQSHADALASQRTEYIQTAKEAILNLTNIKDDTATQDIDRVLSVASGDLKAEYTQRKDAYAQVVKEAKVKASGEVIEAAIESQNDDSAKVLIAAKQTLTNAGDSQPQDRYYRFRVTVNRGDGGVTASKVEFVA